MARVRTFVAIDLGRSVKTRCVSLQAALKREVSGGRWTNPESMHVTLAFLGDVEDRELHLVCKAVGAGCAGHAAFALSAEGVGCFPHAERPRVLWAGLGEGREQLIALQRDVEDALVRTGLHRAEERPYAPHITLAMLKDAEGVPAALTKHAEWHGGEWEAGEVVVMSSGLSRDGPEYAVLSTVRLR